MTDEGPKEVSPFTMAGTANTAKPPEAPVNPDEAREVFPVMFEKDYLDFTGVERSDEGATAPKSSLAPASAGTQTFVTGLEDVSDATSGIPVLQNVEKDTLPKNSQPTSNGSGDSDEGNSNGKTEPPA